MMTQTLGSKSTKGALGAAAVFYLVIALEFLYMASPFAVYFYSIYAPGLNLVKDSPVLSKLSELFLPHIVAESSSSLLDLRNVIGGTLALLGFMAFCIGAAQVYYHKLTRKDVVSGGIYRVIRHPQYASLVACSFGLLLLWPRYIVLLSFVAMVFVYYFLAQYEENECERKFGASYIAYKNRTCMFLPFPLPLTNMLPRLPKAGVSRYLAVLSIYLIASAVAIAAANGLRNWSLDSLYALYKKDAAYVSVSRVEPDRLRRIVDVALADPEVAARTERDPVKTPMKHINYVIPVDWYVSEIPMNRIEGAVGGHHHPKDYDRNVYRIVFTQAELRAAIKTEGKDILVNTLRTTPVVEVLIDLARNKVSGIKNPPSRTKYEGIPLPLY